MLRKLLEILGLLETRQVKEILLNPSQCEPFDSLALIQVLGARTGNGRK